MARRSADHETDVVKNNLAAFQSQDRIGTYDEVGGLMPAESALMERWVPPGSRILDLGVGTGRTYEALSTRSEQYVGIDYAAAMVAAAKERFPAGDFRHGDASDLSAFDDESFDVVVFSYNGLDYLYPYEMRLAALSEVVRVLRPGGVFVVSSHNSRAIVRLPIRTHGKASIARALAVAAVGTARAVASLVPSRTFWCGAGYERDHIQALLTHYTTPRQMTTELDRAGLAVVDVVAGDHPRSLRSLVSPWTYAAAVRPTAVDACIETIEDREAIGGLAKDWDRLHARSASSPFQSRAWVEAWSEHLQPDAEIFVVVARAPSGTVNGLLPLARMRRMAHQRVPIPLQFIGLAGSGPGAGDHLGPLCADDATAALLFSAIPALAGRSSILLENLSRRLATIAAASVGGHTVRKTTCPASIRTPSGSFTDSWSKKMHKNVRRRERKLAELGVAPRWIPSGPEFGAALRSLRSVHARRWLARGTDGLFDIRREQFLLDFAQRSSPPSQPWIVLLEQGDRVVAGLLGFRHRDTFSVYKTGWDPEFARMGPGIALGVEAMRWAEEQNVIVFDYLRGPRGHKDDLGCEPFDDLTVIRSHGVLGRALEWRERLSADGNRPPWVASLKQRLT